MQNDLLATVWTTTTCYERLKTCCERCRFFTGRNLVHEFPNGCKLLEKVVPGIDSVYGSLIHVVGFDTAYYESARYNLINKMYGENVFRAYYLWRYLYVRQWRFYRGTRRAALCAPSLPASNVLGHIFIDLTVLISCFIVRQDAPLRDLIFKMFSEVPTFSYFELVNLFCPRYAPGNRLCKNAAKTVEAANMFDSDDTSLLRSKKCYMFIISCPAI